MWHKAALAILALGLGVLAASYAGAVHPLGDALAVFRLHIAAGCLALSLIVLAVRRWAGATGALASVLALAPILWALFATSNATPGAVSVYQKNMLFVPRDLSPLVADIRAANPDALTLQEVTPGNTVLLSALSYSLPTQLVCPFARVGAVALASRWPQIAGRKVCLERQGFAALQVISDDGPLWIVSIHLHWPWPHSQGPQVNRLLAHLGALEQPVVIGGDFNMVPWSHHLRSIARATGTRRLGRAFDTMTRFSPWVPLPIDHVLVPHNASGATEKRPLLGSDHHGILARFDLGD